jgi:predicted transcriptional regulator of viral defense system
VRSTAILDAARRLGGTVSSAELIDSGARWEDLYRLRDAGELIELSRGIYRLAGAPATAHLDLLAVCRRAPEGTICLHSAASYWDLTDEISPAVHLAIARGGHLPHIAYPPTRVHVFAAATFALGRIQQPIESGDTIAISSPERTVVDLMRLRSRVGTDLALGTLRRYLRRRDSAPGELLTLARQLRIGTVMADALQTLLA